MRRKIIVPIDAIMEMLKAYTGATGDIPTNTIPVSLMINPSEQGLFAIMAESPDWKDDTPIRVNFDIRRVFTS